MADPRCLQSAHPMVLLVDVGNTNLKWSYASPAGLGDIHSIRHHGIDIGELADGCWAAGDVPRRIYLANVAGQGITEQLRRWFLRQWKLSPKVLQSPARALGVISAYQEAPQDLGIDRWLTLVAAHARGESDYCIVDAGTAITIDLLQRDGTHLGGLILPGLRLMADSLLARTHIPRVEPGASEGLLASDTGSAVANAALHAAAALIERTLAEGCRRIGRPVKLLMAGNDASLLQRHISICGEHEPDLVMDGLFVVAKAEWD